MEYTVGSTGGRGGGHWEELGPLILKYFNDEARRVTDGLVPRIFVAALGVKVCPKPRQKPGPGEAWGRG